MFIFFPLALYLFIFNFFSRTNFWFSYRGALGWRWFDGCTNGAMNQFHDRFSVGATAERLRQDSVFWWPDVNGNNKIQLWRKKITNIFNPLLVNESLFVRGLSKNDNSDVRERINKFAVCVSCCCCFRLCCIFIFFFFFNFFLAKRVLLPLPFYTDFFCRYSVEFSMASQVNWYEKAVWRVSHIDNLHIPAYFFRTQSISFHLFIFVVVVVNYRFQRPHFSMLESGTESHRVYSARWALANEPNDDTYTDIQHIWKSIIV